MAQDDAEREELIHALRNAQAEKQALQHLLNKAVERIEDLVNSDCGDAAKQQALEAAERLRRAAEA